MLRRAVSIHLPDDGAERGIVAAPPPERALRGLVALPVFGGLSAAALIHGLAGPDVRASLLPAVTGLWTFAALFSHASGAGARHRTRALLQGGLVAAACVSLALVRWGPAALDSNRTWKWAPAGFALLFVALVGGWIWERRTRTTAPAALLVGALAAALLLTHGRTVPELLSGQSQRTWNLFHYYLGARYFPEVGYFDLYPAVLEADARAMAAGKAPARSFAHVEKARSMRDYVIRPREEIVAEGKLGHISDERMAALGKDAWWLRSREGKTLSARFVLDLGFNPAPPWLLVGRPLASLVPLTDLRRLVVTASDLPVQVAALAALFWGWGPRVGAVAGLFLTMSPINHTLLVGGFLNYDWLAALLGGFAALRRGRPATAALLLSWAAMTRGFPGLLALPLVVRAAWDWLRGRRGLQGRPRRRFAVTFVASCAALLLLSFGVGRGPGVWSEWREKIGHHAAEHDTTGTRRVGLRKAVQHDPRPNRFWRHLDMRRPDQVARADARYRLWLGLGALLLLPALVRRTDEEAAILMLFAVFLLTTASRYYASSWALLFALGAASTRLRAALWLGIIGLCAAFSTLPAGAAYLLLSEGGGLLMAGACVAFLARDAAELVRRRRGGAHAAQTGGLPQAPS